MRKKGYKKMQRRLLRETAAHQKERRRRIAAETDLYISTREKEEIENRIRKIGMNMETINESVPGAVVMIRREIQPETVGNYRNFFEGSFREREWLIEEMAHALAKGIIEMNLAQIITRGKSEIGGPMEELGTIAVKMFVVPWEQMAKAHSKIEIRELVNKFGRDEP